MQVNVTFKHFEGTDEIRDYVVKKVMKLEHFFDLLHTAEAVLTMSKHKYTCDIRLLAKRSNFSTEVTHHDLRLAIDMAVNKLEAQIKKYKEELKE